MDNIDFGKLLVPALRGLARENVLVVASTGGRPVSALLERLGGPLPSNARAPEGDALTAERAEIVQRAIQSLRPTFREIVILREYEGLSYEQIAAITGENQTAVRKRYSRALDELGRYIVKAGL